VGVKGGVLERDVLSSQGLAQGLVEVRERTGRRVRHASPHDPCMAGAPKEAEMAGLEGEGPAVRGNLVKGGGNPEGEFVGLGA
jgi:hypothetical protein